MEQIPTKDLFLKVMQEHDLIVNQKEGFLSIAKGKKNNTSLQSKITLSFLGLVAGILVFIFYENRTGMAITFASGMSLFTLMNLRDREQDSRKRSIKIDSEKIEIKEGYKSKRIMIENIAEFKTSVKAVKNIYLGKIHYHLVN